MRPAQTGPAVPGPARSSPRLVRDLLTDPMTLFRRLRADHGPVVRVPVGRGGFYLVCDPAAVQEVLVGSQRSFAKGFRRRSMPAGQGVQPLALILGQGLLTSSGDLHRTRRRLIQPMFHSRRIAGYGEAFAGLSAAATDSWSDGARLDLHAEMSELTLAIVARTVFDVDIGSEVVEKIRRAVAANLRVSQMAVLPGALRLESRLVFGPPRVARDARRELTEVVLAMIAQRRLAGAAGADLLSLLLTARDADTGEPLDDTSVRDEALTILLAGHETTANALTWCYHLLADAPSARDALHAELDGVLGGRLPTIDDLPSLPYTRAVFAESLRLFPPAWILFRRTVEDVALAGYRIPADATVLLSPWVVHRDPAYWPDPDSFVPERWLQTVPARPDAAPDRPRYAFFPFGGGTRQCIGNVFAEMEGAMVLATVSRRWECQRLPGSPPPTPLPRVTLRPRGGLPVVARRR